MRRQRQQAAAPGWFPVEPVAANTSAVLSGGARGRAADPLGLSRPSNPLRFLSSKPSTRTLGPTANQSRALAAPPDNEDERHRRTPTLRHRKIVAGAIGEHAAKDVAEASMALGSLRLARIPSPPPTVLQQEAAPERHLVPMMRQSDRQTMAPTESAVIITAASPQRARLRRLEPAKPLPLPPPLHELIQTVAEGIHEQEDPLLQLSRASVVQLFMEQWQRQFDADASAFKSIAVRYEVGYRELQRITANLPAPNELLTAFSCQTLDDLTPHFGAFAPIMRVAAAEVRRSIFLKPDEGRVPYFALVHYQKRQLAASIRDRDGQERRNEFLAHEIEHVLATFRRFLDECARWLLRSIIREWYAVAIVHKKNSKKYIEYFSAWFSSSPKTRTPQIFAAWKRQVAQHKLHAARVHLHQATSELSELQRQVDEAAAQRDVAQLELHAVRNDRRQLEDLVQRLTCKIQSANAFLETTQRREPLVANEGHLRVEAVSFLPPLVLESLLRGYHGLGFLQHQCERGGSSIAVVESCDEERSESGVDLTHAPSPTTPSTGASAGLFIRQAFAKIMDIQAQVAACEASTATTDSSDSIAANADITSSFSTAFRDIQSRIRPATDPALAPAVKVLFTDEEVARGAQAVDESSLGALASECVQLLRAMRAQDEHYVRNPKLFSTRLLESHEVSIVPTAASSAASSTPESPIHHQIESPLLSAGRNDLGVINGSRRFSTAPLPMPTRPPGTSSTSNNGGWSRANPMASVPMPPATETPSIPDALVHESDFAMARAPLGSLVALLLARLTTEYGALLFSPSDMTVFAHNAYAPTKTEGADSARTRPLPWPSDISGAESPQSPPPPMALAPTIASPSHWHKYCDLLGAYDTWNRLSSQLIQVGIVQSRSVGSTSDVASSHGGAPTPSSETAAPSQLPNNTDASSKPAVNGAPLPLSVDTTAVVCRPKLLHQLELLPHSALIAKASGSPGRRSSISGGDRLEQAAAAAARLRQLGESADTEAMLTHVKALHQTVLATAEQQSDFRLAKQQLRDLQQLQWSLACQLATPPSMTAPSASAASGMSAPTASSAGGGDSRPHLFECVSFDNAIMARLLSVEREPALELQRVRAVMEKQQLAFRQLYALHRAATAHALSLDELWHAVKLLRLPREVHALAPPTPSQTSQRHKQQEDEDDDDLLLTTSMSVSHHQHYEQLFSPEDLAETLLLLCNEQFPALPSLSARVEHFAVHHLPLVAANTSNSSSFRSRSSPGGVHDLLLQPDVRRALSDHAPTLRVIFRRYCAKERGVQAPTAAAALVTPSGPMELLSSALAVGGGRSAVPARNARAKFLRLNDWLAFLQDYHLLRARFTLERAVSVFHCALGQEAAPPQRPTDERETPPAALEMDYGGFCEAVVAMALGFAPDPFARPATKLSKFISRFLPVAPEDAHDHALPPATAI